MNNYLLGILAISAVLFIAIMLSAKFSGKTHENDEGFIPKDDNDYKDDEDLSGIIISNDSLLMTEKDYIRRATDRFDHTKSKVNEAFGISEERNKVLTSTCNDFLRLTIFGDLEKSRNKAEYEAFMAAYPGVSEEIKTSSSFMMKRAFDLAENTNEALYIGYLMGNGLRGAQSAKDDLGKLMTQLLSRMKGKRDNEEDYE